MKSREKTKDIKEMAQPILNILQTIKNLNYRLDNDDIKIEEQENINEKHGGTFDDHTSELEQQKNTNEEHD
jgi:hypothetical protein